MSNDSFGSRRIDLVRHRGSVPLDPETLLILLRSDVSIPARHNLSVQRKARYDQWMQVLCGRQLKRISLCLGSDARFARGCARHNQTNNTEELSCDGGDAVQCFARVESIDGQFRQIHLSAFFVGWDGRRGYHKDVAENGHEPYLDVDDFSLDVLYVQIVGRG